MSDFRHKRLILKEVSDFGHDCPILETYVQF